MRLDKLTTKFQEALTEAQSLAVTRDNPYIEPAHLLLAMARAIALPARYVCGYVFDAKRGDVIGSHASHAWCELWVPGYGWLGVDPTNKRVVHEAYVASAVGRDYRDATPVSGTYWGSGDREMRVTVHVESK